MAEFPEEVKEGLKILAEHLRDLGAGLELTIEPFGDVTNAGFPNRYITESHKLFVKLPGAESAMVSAWEIVSCGSYRPTRKWTSAEDLLVSRSPNGLAAALMASFGLPDAPAPVVPEPKYSPVPNGSPEATWAIWIKTGDHGIYPESCYDSREAASWTAMRFRMRAEGRGDLWEWTMTPRRTVPLTPEALEELAIAVGVNEDPSACLFLTKADLERWIHPREYGVDGW
jgi:hypothetical protein